MRKHMRLQQTEKFEIIRLVEQSNISVNKTLKELGINKPTFYKWYNAYLQSGYDGLAPKPITKKQYWNQIPVKERDLVVRLALDNTDKASRELATLYVDTYNRYVSESSVYRILKTRGLIRQPAFQLVSASSEFKDKTVRPNEMWQTDFTYFKIPGWGWYYLSTILDDYSRFIVHWKLCSTMKSIDAQQTVDEALQKSNLDKSQMPKLLSDNGSSYIAGDFNDYIASKNMKLIHGKPLHPQTQGKIERYHRSMKNVIKLDVYSSPMELENALHQYVYYYNYSRYHESLQNVTPADKYFGRANRIIKRRMKIKLKTLTERKRAYYNSMGVSKIYSDSFSGHSKP